jgi:hypothetical protein
VLSVLTIDGQDIDSVAFDDPADASQWIRVMAGPSDAPGAESFDVNVCTPGWLQREVSRTGPMAGRHLLVVDTWDAPTVARTIKDLFSSVTGDDWSAIGEKLSRLGYWEFEDYHP